MVNGLDRIAMSALSEGASGGQRPFADARNAVAGALRNSLDYLPERPFKDFCVWVLSQPEYRSRWLQLVGIESLIRMNTALLDGLLEDDESARLTAYGAPLLVYLTYEAISDNLAIGLAGRDLDDAGCAGRAGLLCTFNDAMLARLGGASAHDVQHRLLEHAPAAGKISMFRHSLSEGEHRALLSAYLAAHRDADPRAVEFAALPALIANIESAVAAAGTIGELQTATIFRDGLARRYAAVTELLTPGHATPERLLVIGTDAILVIPTLAHYLGAIAEVMRPLAGYRALLAEGELHRTLTQAALLVRVLNDCGTRLAEQNAAQRRALITDLRAIARSGWGATLSDVLLLAAPCHGKVLARMTKDLAFGEFNVCLDGIRDLPACAETFDALEYRLSHAHTMYERARRGLRDAAQTMTRRLRTNLVSSIVVRFVEIHRRMYADSFTTESGEYAIASVQGTQSGNGQNKAPAGPRRRAAHPHRQPGP